MLLLLLTACTGDDGEGPPSHADFQATATLDDDIPTVAWVEWTTDSPGTSWVEYGPTRDLGRSTVPSTEATTDHAVLLAGLTASSTWYWRAVSEVDGERLQGPVTSIDTGFAPRELPRITTGIYDSTLAQPGYTLTTALGDDSWIIIFDTDGRPVWWKQADPDTVVAQARLSADGTNIVYNVANTDFSVDNSVIRRIRLDGEVLSETRTVLGHHDFVEIADEGVFAYIAADVQEWTDPDTGDTWPVVGDDVVEVPEGATDDSESRMVWSVWDTFDVHVDPDTDSDFYPFGLDWTHCNSLNLQDGIYLVSVRKEDAFAEVDRATGQQLWQLGGIGSDFTQTEGRAFVGQHSPELTEAGFMMFDNGDVSAPDAYSEAVEYSLDEDGRTFTPIWSYDYEQRISSYLLGDVERLENGNTLISWGSGGTLTEVTPDGEMAFQVSLAIGSANGFTHHIDAIGGVAP